MAASSLRAKYSDAPRCGQFSCTSPTRPDVSRKATRFSPSSRTRAGAPPGSGISAVRQAGVQYRRSRSPISVPGPTLVRISLSSALSTPYLRIAEPVRQRTGPLLTFSPRFTVSLCKQCCQSSTKQSGVLERPAHPDLGQRGIGRQRLPVPAGREPAPLIQPPGRRVDLGDPQEQGAVAPGPRPARRRHDERLADTAPARVWPYPHGHQLSGAVIHPDARDPRGRGILVEVREERDSRVVDPLPPLCFGEPCLPLVR